MQSINLVELSAVSNYLSIIDLVNLSRCSHDLHRKVALLDPIKRLQNVQSDIQSTRKFSVFCQRLFILYASLGSIKNISVFLSILYLVAHIGELPYIILCPLLSRFSTWLYKSKYLSSIASLTIGILCLVFHLVFCFILEFTVVSGIKKIVASFFILGWVNSFYKPRRKFYRMIQKSIIARDDQLFDFLLDLKKPYLTNNNIESFMSMAVKEDNVHIFEKLLPMDKHDPEDYHVITDKINSGYVLLCLLFDSRNIFEYMNRKQLVEPSAAMDFINIASRWVAVESICPDIINYIKNL